jgi:2'-5' RNA ligase
MNFNLPTYVVLDVPEPIASEVKTLRARYDPIGVRFPIEITVAGTGGVGPLHEEQDADAALRRLSEVAQTLVPFSARFERVGRFPGTDIFYLVPADPAPFRAAHEAVANCGVKFRPVPFPYTPHCSIRLTGGVSPEHEAELNSLIVPADEFHLERLSVYQVNPAMWSCSRLLEAPLRR